MEMVEGKSQRGGGRDNVFFFLDLIMRMVEGDDDQNWDMVWGLFGR